LAGQHGGERAANGGVDAAAAQRARLLGDASGDQHGFATGETRALLVRLARESTFDLGPARAFALAAAALAVLAALWQRQLRVRRSLVSPSHDRSTALRCLTVADIFVDAVFAW
jgi:hypothetical protein